MQDISKTRLDQKGNSISVEKATVNEKNTNSTKPNCGDCYGARDGCCNTCEDVVKAYKVVGWTINYKDIAQCETEHYAEKLEKQSTEGCKIHGYRSYNYVLK